MLALLLCLSLCACGGNNDFEIELPDENSSQTDSMNHNANNSNGFYDLRGSDANEIALYVPEYWTVEDSFSLPVKLAFDADGTCVATYPDRTEDLYWGYAPSSKIDLYNLYVRIGTQEEILYLFYIHADGTHYRGAIAHHCFLSADGVPIDGLTEDGHEFNWVSAKQNLPADKENNNQNTDNSQQIPDNSQQPTDSYEKIELTVENWDTYFELTEDFHFSQNVFGENNRLNIVHRYKLKDGYGTIGKETEIIMEYSYWAEDRKNCKIDFPAGTYTLGEETDGRHEGSEMVKVDGSSFSEDGYGWALAQSFNYGNDRIRYCTGFQVLRVQGTLYLKKN